MIANLNSSSKDLDVLKKMFLKLDTDNSGTLTIMEIKKGIDTIEEMVGGSKKGHSMQDRS